MLQQPQQLASKFVVRSLAAGAACPTGPSQSLLAACFRFENHMVLQDSRRDRNPAERRLYNLFNFSNFDLPGTALNGLLTGAAGQINGTTRTGHKRRSRRGGDGRLLARCTEASGVRTAGHFLVPEPIVASGSELIDYT